MSNPASTSPATTIDRQVLWMFELVQIEGKEAEFDAVMAEMAEATERNEPGTLGYEWFVSDDGKRVHVLERYADSDAAMTHLNTFGERYMARIFAALTPERMTLYGTPDERVRAALAQLAPPVLSRAAGFSR